MHLTRTVIKELLEQFGLAPSRALGQNFLCDPMMIDKIVRLGDVAEGDKVVEIGPGLGSLTLGLCKAGAEVKAVEIDKYIIPALSHVIAEGSYQEQVNVINEDITKLDWGFLGASDWKVIANLPYNIATPIILDLLREQAQLKTWVVMVQKEAGERLVAESGSKIYGIPSVLAKYWADLKIVGKVPAELFYPKPRVESVLVRIDRRLDIQSEIEFSKLALLVRAGFAKRRKMLRKSLEQHLSSDEIMSQGVDPQARAETLSLDDWKRLTTLI